MPAVSTAAAGVLFAASAFFDCARVVGENLASALAALSAGAGALANVLQSQRHLSSSVDKFASEDQRTHSEPVRLSQIMHHQGQILERV